MRLFDCKFTDHYCDCLEEYLQQYGPASKTERNVWMPSCDIVARVVLHWGIVGLNASATCLDRLHIARDLDYAEFEQGTKDKEQFFWGVGQQPK
eukprot:2367413-Amphidinium_carterae.1